MCVNLLVQRQHLLYFSLLRTQYTIALLLASPGVYVGCLDGIEEEFSHSDALHVDEVGLEQSLRGLKTLSAHLDHTTVWQLEMCGKDKGKKKKKREREGIKEYGNTEETGFLGHYASVYILISSSQCTPLSKKRNVLNADGK